MVHFMDHMWVVHTGPEWVRLGKGSGFCSLLFEREKDWDTSLHLKLKNLNKPTRDGLSNP